MAFDVEKFMEKVTAQNPGEVEFLQAVREVVESLADFLDAHPKYIEHKVLERMVEPESCLLYTSCRRPGRCLLRRILRLGRNPLSAGLDDL